MGEIFILFFSAILVNNFVLTRFLGICPYLGVSRRVEMAVGMSMAVVFVMTLASLVTWLVYNFILVPFDLPYLYIVAFILVIATLVQLVEMVIQKVSPTLYQALGIYLPLITTNCAVLGVAFLNIQEGYGLLKTTIHGLGAGVGFGLAIVLFAGIRERLELADIADSMKGTAIGLVVAGLLSLAFMGFLGLF